MPTQLELLDKATLRPALVEVPPFEFVMVDGTGDPNDSAEFQTAVSLLYSISYPVVMTLKKNGATGLKVGPLEGLWWADDMGAFSVGHGDRTAWQWTMMIRQPSEVGPELYEAAFEKAAKKLGSAAVERARIETFYEGPAAQILHRGPYNEEGPSIARLHEFIADQGLVKGGKHHEIYLSDARRCAPERLRTILRQPVCAQGAPS
jgi:hypothetical protein